MDHNIVPASVKNVKLQIWIPQVKSLFVQSLKASTEMSME